MTHERDEIIRNRSRLKAEYGQLYTDIEQILFRHDPIGIAYEGHDSVEDNPDEYAPEVETILPRLRTANSADDVADIVYEEFHQLVWRSGNRWAEGEFSSRYPMKSGWHGLASRPPLIE